LIDMLQLLAGTDYQPLWSSDEPAISVCTGVTSSTWPTAHSRLWLVARTQARIIEGDCSGEPCRRCSATEQGARPSTITKGPAGNVGQRRQELATRRGDGDGVANNGPHFQVFIFREIHRDHRSYQAVSFTLRSTSPAAMGLARSLPSRKSLTILSISREASGMR